MRICPQCGSENEDQFIYCGKCHKPLPKLSRIEQMRSMGFHAMDKREWRDAENYFDQVVQMNIGDKEAWFMKGVALLHLRAASEARKCFEGAGVEIHGGRCDKCSGTGKCGECGASGTCFMCKSRRKCTFCKGDGECDCGGSPSCPKCGGDGKCIRCKGTGKCVYCGGTGVCAGCDGSKVCGVCGGEGKAIKFVESTLPREWKQYLLR